jgi:hypothetical protein
VANSGSGYRTVQADKFQPFDADEFEDVDTRAHRKFMGLVVLTVVAAALLATLFALAA